MGRQLAPLLLVVTAITACGDDGGGGTDAAMVTPDAPIGARPHPLYPPLDLDTLPGAGGGALGPYEPPVLPNTTRTVTVTTAGQQARDDLQAACRTAGTAVDVPDAAGNIGVVNIGNMDDCDISLGQQVLITTLVIGSLPGPMEAPAHRIRIRGGQVANVLIIGGSSDLVFDGVRFDNAIVPAGQRSGSMIYMPVNSSGEATNRMVVVNSFIRVVGVPAGGADLDGNAYLGRSRNLMFANNNIATGGNRGSWAFRLGGADNTILIDNTVRISMHKFVRMNDNPVDYVYIKGGTWMREATLTSGGLLLNDSFAQLSNSTTDQVYIHDPEVYLLPDNWVAFGMTNDATQVGKRWEARRIQWHALNTTVVSDQLLDQFAANCPGICDYGQGTHTYAYDPALVFPSSPWRDLPTFSDDNPDNLSVTP